MKGQTSSSAGNDFLNSQRSAATHYQIARSRTAEESDEERQQSSVSARHNFRDGRVFRLGHNRF